MALAAGCQNNTIQLEFDTEGGEGGSEDASGSGSTGGGDDVATTGITTIDPMMTTDQIDTESGPDTVTATATATDGNREVSFFADVAPILQNTCAPGCHEPGGEWEVQDLLNSPYFALVGVPATELPTMNKVEPGSLETSYLWHKISGTHLDVGGSGDMMPKGQGALDPVSMETIALWITDGAPNN